MQPLPSVESLIAQFAAHGMTHEVSAEYAAIEGEGDGSLAYWRDGHWRFFSRECKRIGKEPAQTMPVICNVFEVLHVLPMPGEA